MSSKEDRAMEILKGFKLYPCVCVRGLGLWGLGLSIPAWGRGGRPGCVRALGPGLGTFGGQAWGLRGGLWACPGGVEPGLGPWGQAWGVGAFGDRPGALEVGLSWGGMWSPAWGLRGRRGVGSLG